MDNKQPQCPTKKVLAMVASSSQSKRKQAAHRGDDGMATKRSRVDRAHSDSLSPDRDVHVPDNTDTGENNSDIVETVIGDDLESNQPQSAEEQLGKKKTLIGHCY